MITLGVDAHKKYSQVAVLNDDGNLVMNVKVANQRQSFESLLKELNGSCQAVLEAGYSWGPTYDLLDELDVDVKVAHPQKVRAIAAAKIKTDSIDAYTLAKLLKADLIPEVFVPSKDIRQQKSVLRQRIWLVKIRTAIKNRVHALLTINHIDTASYSDLFGKNGKIFLSSLSLPETERNLLDQDLEILSYIDEHIERVADWISALVADKQTYSIIKDIPGFGKVLTAIASLEIYDISRFDRPEKLASYAGLIPSTYSSGGRTFHGQMISGCNHWLRYAFIEAAWSAIKHSSYFKSFYLRIKSRKTTNIAIAAVARKLSETVYHCLKNNRRYQERPYIYKKTNVNSSGRLATFLTY